MTITIGGAAPTADQKSQMAGMFPPAIPANGFSSAEVPVLKAKAHSRRRERFVGWSHSDTLEAGQPSSVLTATIAADGTMTVATASADLAIGQIIENLGTDGTPAKTLPYGTKIAAVGTATTGRAGTYTLSPAPGVAIASQQYAARGGRKTASTPGDGLGYTQVTTDVHTGQWLVINRRCTQIIFELNNGDAGANGDAHTVNGYVEVTGVGPRAGQKIQVPLYDMATGLPFHNVPASGGEHVYRLCANYHFEPGLALVKIRGNAGGAPWKLWAGAQPLGSGNAGSRNATGMPGACILNAGSDCTAMPWGTSIWNTVGVSNKGYFSFAVAYTEEPGEGPAVFNYCLDGDSIMQSQDGLSWAERVMLALNQPCKNYAVSGSNPTQVPQFATLRLKHMKPDRVICNHGKNGGDINDIVRLCKMYRAMGAEKVFWTLITNTTNVANTAVNSAPTQLNADIRAAVLARLAGNGDGPDGFIDVPKYCQDPATGLWLPNFSNDGLHPNTTANAAIDAGVRADASVVAMLTT